MRTIRVTGKGTVRLRPDTTRITMNLEGLFPEYGETLRRSSEDTDTLKNVLAGFGFEGSDLKTVSFGVETEYESYREDDVYKQRFAGYRFRHTLKVEFGSDNELLGRLLYALANCGVDPELHLSYTVKDAEAAKNELLGKAVEDAKEKAAVLTRAAGAALKDIRRIDYSWGEADLECRPMNGSLQVMRSMGAGAAAKSYDLNIEPDDIVVTDSVTVIWEIV